MNIRQELTLLLGVELRDRISAGVTRINDKLGSVAGVAARTSASASASMAKLDGSLYNAGTAAGILKTRNIELASAQEGAKLATSEFIQAQALYNASGKDAIGIQDLLIRKTNQYEASLARVAGATATAAEAQGAYDATQTAAKGGGVKSKIGGALSRYGATAAMVAAGVGAIGVKAAQASVAYEDFGRKIGASAGQSKKYGEDLANTFLKMSETSIFSGEEMSGAFAKVAGVLANAEHPIKGAKDSITFMTAANNLAAASGNDLTSTTKGLTSVMTAYGQPASKAQRVSELLYNTSRVTGMGMGQLATMVGKLKGNLGSAAPKLGETLTLMTALKGKSIDGRNAIGLMNTVFGKFLTTGRASTPTFKEVSTALQSLPAALQPVAKAYQDGTLSADEFKKKLKDPSIDAAGKKYLGMFKSLVDRSKESEATLNGLKLTPVQDQLSKLGVTAFDAHGKFIGMGKLIGELGPKFNAMGSDQERLRVGTLLFGASAKKILPIIEAGKKGWDAASKKVRDHQKELKAAQDAQNSYEGKMKQFHNTLHSLQISFGNVALPLINTVLPALSKVFSKMADFMKHNKKLIDILLVVVGAIATAVAALWTIHKAFKAVGAIKKMGEEVIELAGKYSGLADNVDKAGNATEGFSKKALKSLGGGLKKGVSAIKDGFMTVGKAAVQMAIKAVVALGEMAVAAWAAVAPFLPIILAVAAVGVAIYFLVKHWHTVWGVIKKVVSAIKNFIVRIFDDIIGFFKKWGVTILRVMFPWINIPILIAQHWHGIVDFFKGILNKIVGFFKRLPGQIWDGIKGIWNKMFDFGKNLIHGLVEGIKSVAGMVGGALKNVFDKIPGVSLLKKVPGLSWLAEGGLVTKPTLAVVGEAGPEMVVPLKKMGLSANSAHNVHSLPSMSGRMSGNMSGGHTTVVNIHMDGHVYGSLDDFARKLGNRLATNSFPHAGVVINR